VTLLGQNVNSYNDLSTETATLFTDAGVDKDGKKLVKNAQGFKTIYKPKVGGVRFADLLEVSFVPPSSRIQLGNLLFQKKKKLTLRIP
jgi:hypothetical protein